MTATAPDPALYFHHPQEVWDDTKCAKMAKRRSDGAPFRGYLGSSASMPPAFGKVRYNGGCVREEKWFQGEFFPFPALAPGYKIIHVSSWGWQIVKDEEIKTEE